MLTEWRKFKGWAVLEYFLKSPNTKVHIRGLSRDINIGPLTAQKYLQLYRDENILKEEKVANSLQYSLNNALPLVKSLKRFYFLETLGKFDVPESIITLAVFGAHASGEYTEHSDIDILVITPNKPDLSFLKKIEKSTAKTVDITSMTLGGWRRLVKKGDGFVESILRNHILLYGAQI
jgi:predicted nucleotidyltransferase